jgi:cytoskeleton protein RodZ
MGGARPSSTSAEIFEAADPARTMPRWLVLSALGAIVLVVLALSWFNNRQLTEAPPPLAEPSEEAAPADSAPQGTAAAPATSPAAASGPVVLGAAEPVWLQVYERGGATLFQGELAAGQSYQVPPGATAPLLRTGKPEALRITVGGRPVPPVGPPARTVSNVSLLGPDLLSGGAGGGRGAPVPSVPQPSAPPGIGNTAG